MTKLRFAVNRRWRDNNGEWQEETSFFSGTLWRDHAENVAESLQKGSRVIVVGRLEQRSWETQEGEKRSVVEVAIDEVGPSLRWATASVNKTARSGGGDFATSGSVPPGPVARDDYGPDEAPF
jgi:single-strand DNA-binding protein